MTSITESVTTYSPTLSISIASSANTICSGTNVIFNATTVNGGISPTYQWKKNGVNVGTNNSSYSNNSLANGDIITCVITTSSSASATSNNITMIVNDAVTPSITINASKLNICSPANVTFNSIIQNGGNNPAFQWKLNNINTGNGSNSYSNNNLVPGDLISCVMNSNASCINSSIVSSNTITMTCLSSITLNLKIIIDGYYNSSSHLMIPLLFNTGNSTNNLEVDTITVELHAASSPYPLIESSKGILKVDGFCSLTLSPERVGLPYYIVLKHRNALETWSKTPVILNAVTEYDFIH